VCRESEAWGKGIWKSLGAMWGLAPIMPNCMPKSSKRFYDLNDRPIIHKHLLRALVTVSEEYGSRFLLKSSCIYKQLLQTMHIFKYYENRIYQGLDPDTDSDPRHVYS
jgi:hypothetical protein